MAKGQFIKSNNLFNLLLLMLTTLFAIFTHQESRASALPKTKENSYKEAFKPEKMLPAGVDGAVVTNPYTGSWICEKSNCSRYLK